MLALESAKSLRYLACIQATRSNGIHSPSPSLVKQTPEAPIPVQPAPEVAPPAATTSESAPSGVNHEPAPEAAATVDDFDLPLKKKKRRLVRDRRTHHGGRGGGGKGTSHLSFTILFSVIINPSQ